MQNLDLDGAFAPPFAMPRSFDLCGFAAHTRLTIGRGVQGGASLDCIKIGSKTELLITIMSSLAQEESRSISENTTWGKRKQFAEGKTSVGYSAFLGYDKDFQINEEQAKIVRLIYKLFVGGRSFYAITKELGNH